MISQLRSFDQFESLIRSIESGAKTSLTFEGPRIKKHGRDRKFRKMDNREYFIFIEKGYVDAVEVISLLQVVVDGVFGDVGHEGHVRDPWDPGQGSHVHPGP